MTVCGLLAAGASKVECRSFMPAARKHLFELCKLLCALWAKHLSNGLQPGITAKLWEHSANKVALVVLAVKRRGRGRGALKESERVQA